ncbi:MAG: ComF family protein [Planctomycetes bacterium]|nr:ComF family protein [Planctomycetota bacterium]
MAMSKLSSMVDLFFPRACALCADLLGENQRGCLCTQCLAMLVPLANPCRKCGAPLGDGPLPGPESKRRKPAASCRWCKNRRWQFQRVLSFTVYSGAAIQAVRKMKEPAFEGLTRQLGDRMGDWLTGSLQSASEPPIVFAPEHYDAVIPIPQHWFRKLTHRYNQADVLARRVSAAIDQPVRSMWLYRSRWTQKQGMKTVVEREFNMFGAFRAGPSKALTGKRLLLVDDVMTSGATLHQAASVLRGAGAVHVDAVVFARGINASRQQSSNISDSAEQMEPHDSSSDPDFRRKIH